MSIVLQDLVKGYGGHAVVDRVSLEINDGELFVLLGSSGSGKSTILRMIAGLTPADAGRISLQGRDVTALPPQKRNTGFVFQNYSLFQHMTVAQNVEFGLAVRKRPRRERVSRRDELLALVGLTGFARRYPSQLSGGQQQRVALARALASEPSVLLLDEPLGALDVKIRTQLRRSLHRIQRELRVTTILVTHDQEEAFELGDRIGVIERGRLLAVGPPGELYRRPRHEIVASFVGESNLVGARASNGRLRIGDLEVRTPEGEPEDERCAVLFRPEQLTVAARKKDLRDPALGQGVVEEIRDLGALARLRVRLEGVDGVFPLGKDFGESGLPLGVLLPASEEEEPFRVGERVWVGARGYHVLPQQTRRMLVLTDASAQGRQTLPLATLLARSMGASAKVLCVAKDERSAQRLLESLREGPGAASAELTFEARTGGVERAMDEELGRGRYDLVVLSVGGDLAAIARHSSVSVLIASKPRPEIRRVLLCTAAGEPGKLDVLFGAEIARSTGAAATLLYVEEETVAGFGRTDPKRRGKTRETSTAGWIERHLEQGLRTLSGQGVSAQPKVRRGQVLEEVLSEASEGDYDLLVIGGHRKRTWFRTRERDLAANLLARSDRPVLVVKGSS